MQKFNLIYEMTVDHYSGGDGGAIVLNKENKAIGMVIGRSYNPPITILVPMKQLCRSLNIKLI